MTSFQDKLKPLSDDIITTSYEVVNSQFLDAVLARCHALHDMELCKLDNPLRQEHINDFNYYSKEVAEVGAVRDELLKDLIRRGLEPSYKYPVV